MSRRLLVGLAVTAATLTTLSTGPSATADEATDAPVTKNDRVVVRGGGVVLADVLANDSDPNGDRLEICRLEIPDGVPLNNGSTLLLVGDSDEDFPEPLVVSADRFTPGRYEITYYACDLDYLTPATVTVIVKRTRPVRARKVGPHAVRFTNPDNRPVRVFYADGRLAGEGATVRLPAGASKRVRVDVRSIWWFASARDGGQAGQGTVRGLAGR